ncbi:MAG: rhomboid family intramembrane serine protease [Hyphomicrobiaceae bacterium]|nr:rhomboid family intramembrane serine protease [Hyphomicrobiaceae bacterium]
MFVPVHDINPLKRLPFQWATVSLITLNVLAYLVLTLDLFAPANRYAVEFALVPAEFLGRSDLPSQTVLWGYEPLPLPEATTLLTYMFVHGGFFHLAGNMTFLWVFGDNVEDAMGHWRFLLFYMLCGVIAALVHVAMAPDSETPVVGASGAVAGIIGAYLMLHPNVRIWVLVLYRIPLRLTAAWLVGLWVALQVYYAFFDKDHIVAWDAHLGGLVAGVILILFMRRQGVALFDRTITRV